MGAAIFYELPEMLVNLNTAGNKRNFLKMLISLELASENDAARVETVMPRIMATFKSICVNCVWKICRAPGAWLSFGKNCSSGLMRPYAPSALTMFS